METQTIDNHHLTKKTTRFNLIDKVNKKIEEEKNNAIGISIALIMLGTGIASLTAALAVNKDVSLVILMTSTILAMGANVAVISQQSFKTIIWVFFINITINTLLLFYQIIMLHYFA